MTDDKPWLSYEYSRPQQDLPIIIGCGGRDWRDYRETVVVPENFPPEFNVSGLRWRPTGIFTELGGKIYECGAQQANALGFGPGGSLGNLGGFLAGLGAGCSTGLGSVQLSREEYGVQYPGEKRKWL